MANAEGKIDLGRVATNTFGVIGRNPLVFLGLSLLIFGLPNALIQYLQGNPFDVISGEAAPVSNSVAAGLLTILSFLLAMVLQATLIVASVKDLNNKAVDLSSCISLALRKFLPLIGLGIVSAIGMTFGLLLLIIPGVILYLMWIIAVPVMMSENTGVIDSLKRSAELTKGSKRWIFLLLVAFIVFSWVGIGVSGLFATMGSFIWPIGVAVVQTVVGAIQGAGIASIYIDLRNTKEGADTSGLADVFG